MKNKPQLLLIDNNASMLRLLTNLLSEDYQIIAKTDAVDAYNWLQDGHYPALAVTDIHTAEGAAFPLVRNLKISGLYRDMPVVLLSSANADAQQQGEAYSADACFKKPFNPERLKDAIRHLITARYATAA